MYHTQIFNLDNDTERKWVSKLHNQYKSKHTFYRQFFFEILDGHFFGLERIRLEILRIHWIIQFESTYFNWKKPPISIWI